MAATRAASSSAAWRAFSSSALGLEARGPPGILGFRRQHRGTFFGNRFGFFQLRHFTRDPFLGRSQLSLFLDRLLGCLGLNRFLCGALFGRLAHRVLGCLAGSLKLQGAPGSLFLGCLPELGLPRRSFDRGARLFGPALGLQARFQKGCFDLLDPGSGLDLCGTSGVLLLPPPGGLASSRLQRRLRPRVPYRRFLSSRFALGVQGAGDALGLGLGRPAGRRFGFAARRFTGCRATSLLDLGGPARRLFLGCLARRLQLSRLLDRHRLGVSAQSLLGSVLVRVGLGDPASLFRFTSALLRFLGRPSRELHLLRPPRGFLFGGYARFLGGPAGFLELQGSAPGFVFRLAPGGFRFGGPSGGFFLRYLARRLHFSDPAHGVGDGRLVSLRLGLASLGLALGCLASGLRLGGPAGRLFLGGLDRCRGLGCLALGLGLGGPAGGFGGLDRGLELRGLPGRFLFRGLAGGFQLSGPTSGLLLGRLAGGLQLGGSTGGFRFRLTPRLVGGSQGLLELGGLAGGLFLRHLAGGLELGGSPSGLLLGGATRLVGGSQGLLELGGLPGGLFLRRLAGGLELGGLPDGLFLRRLAGGLELGGLPGGLLVGRSQGLLELGGSSSRLLLGRASGLISHPQRLLQLGRLPLGFRSRGLPCSFELCRAPGGLLFGNLAGLVRGTQGGLQLRGMALGLLLDGLAGGLELRRTPRRIFLGGPAGVLGRLQCGLELEGAPLGFLLRQPAGLLHFFYPPCRVLLGRDSRQLLRSSPFGFLLRRLARGFCLGRLARRLLLRRFPGFLLLRHPACGVRFRGAQGCFELGDSPFGFDRRLAQRLQLADAPIGLMLRRACGSFSLASQVLRLSPLFGGAGLTLGRCLRCALGRFLRRGSRGFELGGLLLGFPFGLESRLFRCSPLLIQIRGGPGSGGQQRAPRDLLGERTGEIRTAARPPRDPGWTRAHAGAVAFRPTRERLQVLADDLGVRLHVRPVEQSAALALRQRLRRHDFVEGQGLPADVASRCLAEETAPGGLAFRGDQHRTVPHLAEVLPVRGDLRVRQLDSSVAVTQVPADQIAGKPAGLLAQGVPRLRGNHVSGIADQGDPGSAYTADQDVRPAVLDVLAQVTRQQTERTFVPGGFPQVIQEVREGALRDEDVVGSPDRVFFRFGGCPQDAPQQGARHGYVKTLRRAPGVHTFIRLRAPVDYRIRHRGSLLAMFRRRCKGRPAPGERGDVFDRSSKCRSSRPPGS